MVGRASSTSHTRYPVTHQEVELDASVAVLGFSAECALAERLSPCGSEHEVGVTVLLGLKDKTSCGERREEVLRCGRFHGATERASRRTQDLVRDGGGGCHRVGAQIPQDC